MEFQVIQDIETVIELTELTMEEFAKALGVSRITVNNWISGKKDISEKNISSFYEYTFNKGIRLNKIKEQLYAEEIVDKSEVILFHGAKTVIEGELRLDCSKRKNDRFSCIPCGNFIRNWLCINDLHGKTKRNGNPYCINYDNNWYLYAI